MVEVWALYMLVVIPFKEPIQLRDNEVFETEAACIERGKTRSMDVAQSISDHVGVPVRFQWRCVKEGASI